VAADYGINSYFSDPRGVFVNLYIPSKLQWRQDGAQISLTQSGNYPFDSLVRFEMTASKALEFALNFRIPGWAKGASISVNGKRLSQEVVPGSFAAAKRSWKRGDLVELELPLTQRLQPIDSRHPNTAALVSGPLVLFAITDKAPVVTERQLLSAQRVGNLGWQVETTSGMMNLLPFTAIQGEAYSTYLSLG
jgi:DUF1680 family protein